MTVIITGDSHTGALEKGRQLLADRGDWPELVDMTIKPLGGGHIFPTPFFIDRGDHAEISDLQFRKRFKRLPLSGSANSDVIYGLAGPLHTARLRRRRAWSEFVPT